MSFFSKKYLLLILSLFCFCSVWTQKEYNNWVLGKKGQISFNSSQPTSSIPISLNSGCGIDSVNFSNKYTNLSTISDNSGDLLFISGACTVWDKRRQVMPNGEGLTGIPYAANSQVVIKKPDSRNEYYLFYIDSIYHNLNYALIDMSLNAGLGDVLYKNRVLLNYNVTNQITATKNGTGCANWLIAHAQDTGLYFSFRVTSSGVDSIPVLSYTGIAPVLPKDSFYWIVDKNSQYRKQLKNTLTVSPRIKEIIFSDFQVVELSSFNSTTGVISNSQNIVDTTLDYFRFGGLKYVSGTSFSPNSRYVYTLNNYPASLYRFNVTETSLKLIRESAEKAAHFSRNELGLSNIQLGPNGKLYFSHTHKVFSFPHFFNSNLGVINNPDADDINDIGVEEFSKLNVYNTYSSPYHYYSYNYSVPNTITLKIPFVDGFDLGDDVTKCVNKSVLLKPSYKYTGDAKYLWSTGDTIFSIVVRDSGKYWVKAIHDCGVSTDTIEVINIYDTTDLNIGIDSITCEREIDLITPKIYGVNYLWSTNSIDTITKVDKSANYWLETNSVCGLKRDTIKVSFFHDSVPKILLGKDTALCASEYKIITNNIPFKNQKYLWNTGDTVPDILISKSGKYWVQASNICNTETDTIDVNIDYDGITNFSIGNDTVVCTSYALQSLAIPNTRYLWSTGDTTLTTNVTQTDTYWLQATTPCSIKTDTINVVLITDTLQPIRLGNDTTICGTNFILNTGANQNAYYLWSTGDTTKDITITQNKNYKLIISNPCYTKEDSITITLVQDPINNINLGTDTLLCNDELELSLPNIVGAKYTWNTGDTSTQIKAKQSGIYKAQLTTPICNNTYTDSIKVEFHKQKPLQLSSDTTICQNDFKGVTLNVNNDFIDYLWDNGNNSSSIEVNQEGIYSISVTDTCGDTYTKTTTVTLCDCKLYVPNTFTPNKDGKNEGYRIYNYCGFTIYHLKIFNRWGQLLYQTQDPEEAWDGTYDGKPVTEGIYLVSLRYGYKGAKTRNSDFNGLIHLLR